MQRAFCWVSMPFWKWLPVNYLLYFLKYIHLYVYIIIKKHWQYGFPWLFLSIRFYPPLLLAGFSNYILRLHRAGVGKFLLVSHNWGSIEEYLFGVRSCFAACLLHLTCMVFEMGGKWLYCCCFMGCCLKDLFKIPRSIFLLFLSSFSSMCFVSVHEVHTHTHTHTHIYIYIYLIL